MAVRVEQETSPYVEKAWAYARGVVTELIPANKWVKLCCKRMLDDLERAGKPGFEFFFDNEQATRPCLFIESLPHVKGKWEQKNELIVLQPWQCFIVCMIFGWLRVSDVLRRFREVYAEIPRKNGKSVLAAAIGLFMFSMDNESGAEVYSGATSEKQAWEVFRPARQMALKTDALRLAAGIEVNAKTLSKAFDLSTFAPVIGKPGDGASPSCALIDEFHEHATPDLVETMDTGMGAREQPLLIQITTAGTNLAGPCYTKHLECRQVLEGVMQNDRLFCIMYGIDAKEESEDGSKTAEAGDDWASPSVLRKANPNYDVSVFSDFLVAQQRKALFNPAAQRAFKTKHLNCWGGARSPWMPMYLWDLCADEQLSEEEFAGEPAYFILDLASKDDIAVSAKLFPKTLIVGGKPVPNYYAFARYYIPEAALSDPDNPNGSAYRKWHKMGLLTATEGDEIDFDVIKDDFVADKNKFQVIEGVFDPWRATQLAHQLQKEGAEMVEMRQIIKTLSAPMKETLSAVKGRRFHHDGNAVTKWMVSNVTCKTDAKDNVYPRKERNHMKIDGAVAIIMGMARAIVSGENGSFADWLRDPVVGGGGASA